MKQKNTKKRYITGIFPIISFEILNTCESIEKIQDPEQEEESGEKIITSKVKIVYNKKGRVTKLILALNTLIDDVKNIIDVYSDPELIK